VGKTVFHGIVLHAVPVSPLSVVLPCYLHLATSKMCCWSGGMLRKLYYYNGAQRYEHVLQVDQLYRALILLGLALYLPSISVSSVFMVLYI